MGFAGGQGASALLLMPHVEKSRLARLLAAFELDGIAHENVGQFPAPLDDDDLWEEDKIS